MSIAQSSDQQCLNLAFIGGGINSAVGHTHFSAAQMDGRWRVVAGAFSRDPATNQRTASRWNVAPERCYQDWREMLDQEGDRVDAVAVLTPTPAHIEPLEVLLKRGITVICEKAFVSSLEDARHVCQLQNEHNSFVAVTYNYSGYPMVRELRERIRRGELGKIQQLHIEMPQEGFVRPPDIAGQTAKPQSWRLRDGFVPTICLDLGVHLHHLAWFLLEESPTAMNADFSTYSSYPGIIDDVTMWMRYDSGIRSNFWMTKTTIGMRNGLRLRIFGNAASAEWYQQDSEYLRLSSIDGAHYTIDRGGQAIVAKEGRYNRMKVGHPSGFIEAFANLYTDIADAVIEWKKNGYSKNPFVTSPHIACEGIRLFHLARESHITKSWVTL